jgi:lysophospholipase L1-like esterase
VIPAVAKPERVAVAAAVMVGGLAAEVAWTARRRLPTLAEIDVSGTVGHGPGPPIRLVALGDSTVTAPGIADRSGVWLHQALLRLDPSPSVEVVSLAVGGSRIADVADTLDEAVALDPDLVVIAVGSNDAIHATPARRFETQLDDVLRRLLATVGIVAVANIGDLGNVARVHRPLDTVLRRRSHTLCRRVERVVAAHQGAVLLDVTTTNEAFRDPSIFAADLFHPSETGHSIWADAALPGLQLAFDRLRSRQAR